jgi:hypothetical protein
MAPSGAFPAIHCPIPMKTTGEATLAALMAHPRAPRWAASRPPRPIATTVQAPAPDTSVYRFTTSAVP